MQLVACPGIVWTPPICEARKSHSYSIYDKPIKMGTTYQKNRALNNRALFCSCADDVSIWWQMFNFVFLYPKRLFQFNPRTVRAHFLSIMTLNNWKMVTETRSYIFRWRSRFRRRRVCLSSLLTHSFIIYLFIIFHIYLFCTRFEFLRWIKSRNENDQSILCYFSWMPCLWFKA